MKVGLEALVSYFPDTIMRREDFAHLDSLIPKAMQDMFRGPDEIRRLSDETPWRPWRSR